jgi:hypothetical protein
MVEDSYGQPEGVSDEEVEANRFDMYADKLTRRQALRHVVGGWRSSEPDIHPVASANAYSCYAESPGIDVLHNSAHYAEYCRLWYTERFVSKEWFEATRRDALLTCAASFVVIALMNVRNVSRLLFGR